GRSFGEGGRLPGAGRPFRRPSLPSRTGFLHPWQQELRSERDLPAARRPGAGRHSVRGPRRHRAAPAGHGPLAPGASGGQVRDLGDGTGEFQPRPGDAIVNGAPVPDKGVTSPPRAPMLALDTLWLYVAGTICNLRCTHCFISCAPDNHSHGMMTLEEARRHLDDAGALGVREYYLTGGEPFMNRELLPILEA